MSKVNTTIRDKDALLENVKQVIGYAETLTVEYSSQLVDATVVTNEVNKIQNDVTPIVWVAMTGQDHVIVEDATDGFYAPTNMENLSTQKKHILLQGVLYIFVNKY